MGFAIVRSRRTKMDITVAILKITNKEVTKTQIVYGTNLNFILAGKYLDFLKQNGFIESPNRATHYQITDKGREFLEKIQEVMI